ncbi:hypothetical protein L5515_014185 [Caenorhabditis briggsae]|uniref:SH3 domain-containing protein n=1 Tax=Caenorhabditis briggsae TaxID=6238 RepID=A0AAE9E8G7_CAEBR|nr:hypothetical protein L5515_014185 [Caenorhabditis briggsae]
MSLFGSILSLQDAINRLPQFEHQINRLEKDQQDSSSRASLRKHFVRRCLELHKQLDDHRNRIEKIRNEGAYKKENAIEQVEKLKQRLSLLCPEKEPNSISISVDSEEEKSDLSKLRSNDQRRKSVMYDADDSQEDSDNESKIIETDVNLDGAAVPSTVIQPPPQPKPRQPIAITQPSLAPTIAERDRVESEIASLQNPTRGDTSQFMEPVIVRGNVFVAFDNWDPEAEGDLRLVKGMKYRITQTRADGWWTALDENGQRGLVPKTYLQHLKEKPKTVQSKVSSRLGVRDSVIALTTTTTNTPNTARRDDSKRQSRQNDCLGKAFDDDIHLSLVCHMTPRLSTSNIGFHDLFWSPEKDQVFKRTIHISKIIRLVRFEKMPLLEHKALVRMALVDITNPKSTQVVSNVHTLVPRVKGSIWSFEKKEINTRSCIEFSDFVLRSNYSAPTVVLVIEASHIVKTTIGFEEKSLGHTYLRLIIDDKAVPSRTNVLYLDDEIMSKMKIPEASKKRVMVQVMDVPKDKISYVDSLPDVIIFNALYLPFFHYYRRRAGTILIRDNKNPLSAEYVSDPLLSVFPFICDQHDIMDVMLKLWKAKKKLLAKKTEAEQTAEFFQTFVHTAFFIRGIQIISYDIKDDVALSIRHQTFLPIIDALNKGLFKQFIANQKCLPVNILDYSLDLLGSHSID